MRYKKRFFNFILLFIGSFCFSNTKLENDLTYLRRVLTEAYVGYEYNENLGFNLDQAIDNVRKQYIEKMGFDDSFADKISDDLLAECINNEILIKLKIPDNHFGIYSKNSYYGYDPQKWFSSKIFFAKEGNDYYVSFSLNPRIRRKARYTGKKENLFEVILLNKRYYVFGIFSNSMIKNSEISINNKNYKTRMYIGNYIYNRRPGHIGMKKTKKSVYLSFSDCTFYGQNKNDHTVLFRKLEDYLREIKKNHYENFIIDLRGNSGGIISNLIPVLKTINFEGDYKNCDKVTKKIKTFRSSNIKDTELIRKARSQYQEENPAYKYFLVEDSATEYYKKQPAQEYDFEPDYKGNVIIVCDFNSASAAELFIAYSYIFENVYLIGTNTSGTIDFGSMCDYYLPESGIKLHIASESFKESAFLQNNLHWHGDKKGFYPDYWCTNNSLLPTLVFITKDKKLRRKLHGLSERLL